MSPVRAAATHEHINCPGDRPRSHGIALLPVIVVAVHSLQDLPLVMVQYLLDLIALWPAPLPDNLTERRKLFKGATRALAKAIASIGTAARGPGSGWSYNSSSTARAGDDADSGDLGSGSSLAHSALRRLANLTWHVRDAALPRP